MLAAWIWQIIHLYTIGLRHGLMIPGSPVLEPQIHFTGLFSPGIIHYAGPDRIYRIKANIHSAILIKVWLSGIIIASHSQHITLHDHLVACCIGTIGIDIDRATIRSSSIVSFFCTLGSQNCDVPFVSINNRQVIIRCTCITIERIHSKRRAANSCIYITIKVNYAFMAVRSNGNPRRMPTGTGVIGISRSCRSMAVDANTAMHFSCINAPVFICTFISQRAENGRITNGDIAIDC